MTGHRFDASVGKEGMFATAHRRAGARWLPWRQGERARLLDVQVVAIEEVLVGGATEVEAGVARLRPVEQQAEEADGGAQLEVRPAGGHVVGVQETVAMEIRQGPGGLGTGLVVPVEPHHLPHLDTPGTLVQGRWRESVCRVVSARGGVCRVVSARGGVCSAGVS